MQNNNKICIKLTFTIPVREYMVAIVASTYVKPSSFGKMFRGRLRDLTHNIMLYSQNTCDNYCALKSSRIHNIKTRRAQRFSTFWVKSYRLDNLQ